MYKKLLKYIFNLIHADFFIEFSIDLFVAFQSKKIGFKSDLIKLI